MDASEPADIVSQWPCLPLEEVECCLCGSGDRRELCRERFAGYEFRVVECMRCGLAFTSPRPSAALREAVHTPAVRNALVDAGIIAARHRIPEDHEAIFDYAHQEAYRPNYQRGLRLLSRLASGPRLLDVGCAGGMFLELAREEGFQASGCDIMPAAIAEARRRGLDAHCCPLEEAPFAPETFGALTLWNVIEHVPNPVELVRAAARFLCPRGVLYVETPNFWLRRWQLTRGKAHDPDAYPLISFEHIHHFTPRSLRATLAAAGLEWLRWDPWNTRPELGPRQRVRRWAAIALYYASLGQVNLATPLVAVARKP